MSTMRPQTIIDRHAKATEKLAKAEARAATLRAELEALEALLPEAQARGEFGGLRERNATIAALRLADGLPYAKIAERFGLSVARIRQIVDKEYRIARYHASKGLPTPAWFHE
jgi:DNA-directed RNA polymerase specialized sigma24 family protein